MTRQLRSLVGVTPIAAYEARPRLWTVLESIYPVTIRGCPPDNYDGLAGLVAVGDREILPTHQMPILQAFEDESEKERRVTVDLAAHTALDYRLRGQRLSESHFLGTHRGLTGGHVALASIASRPVWTVDADAEVWHQSTAALAAELGPDEVLRDRLSPGRFLALLPLLEMLRHVGGAEQWSAPSLRAAFMLDDPNLHWTSYGFANFADLANSAKRCGFHVAIATVPLDSWFSHPAAVSLFRQHDELSLLVHGNDHIWCELGRDLPEQALVGLGAQAQRRIAGLEDRTGLSVARVMAPPHGACSHGMLAALRRTGFDAACISRPFPWLERAPGHTPAAQWQIGDVLPRCVPVLPRYSLTSDLEDIVLRAYLDQPLILYGHHGDLRDGGEVLADLADKINAFGDVNWMSLEKIAAGNYLTRSRDEELQVRLFTRRARIQLHTETTRLSFHSELLDIDPAEELLELRRQGAHPVEALLDTEIQLPAGSGEVEVRVRARDAVDPRLYNPPARSLWPRARRLLVEGRDRLAPLAARLSR